MRYQSRRMEVMRRIWVLLFCVAMISAEMNSVDRDTYTHFSGSDTNTAGALSAVSSHNKQIDAIDKTLGTLTDEAMSGISSGLENTFSFRIYPLKYLFLKTVLFYIPLILWTILIILLQSGYVSRRYLISFIHNSDGEKGEAGILTV